jgi:hypothetical protein
MPDEKTHHRELDPSRMSGSDDDEIDHFARHHGITRQQARDLIDKHGDNRKELIGALSELKTLR